MNLKIRFEVKAEEVTRSDPSESVLNLQRHTGSRSKHRFRFDATKLSLRITFGRILSTADSFRRTISIEVRRAERNRRASEISTPDLCSTNGENR